MKLFTSIYDDAKLLGHFLRHYEQCGVTEFFIAVLPKVAPTVASFMAEYRITVFTDLDVDNSWLTYTHPAMTEMRRKRQGPAEWVIIVDLDEFVAFVPDIPQLIATAEREGANVVRGTMYDRFSLDGSLKALDSDVELSELFPVKARFIFDVMRGWDHKGVLVKGLLEPISTHHAFAGEKIASTNLEISHYKWTIGAIDRLKSRCAVLDELGSGWADEYKRVIEHYEQHGRFAWNEFGGMLVSS